MHQVSIYEAKTNLSRLIKEALGGGEVVIANRHQPLVRITPLPKMHLPRKIGGCKGFARKIASDFITELDDFGHYTA